MGVVVSYQLSGFSVAVGSNGGNGETYNKEYEDGCEDADPLYERPTGVGCLGVDEPQRDLSLSEGYEVVIISEP